MGDFDKGIEVKQEANASNICTTHNRNETYYLLL
jgi:hypothetical protein